MKTATMSYERRCCQTFPATVLALDPTANHHSSLSWTKNPHWVMLVFTGLIILEPTTAARHVHLPFFLYRQYNFAMLNA
jgi:hypothetical protein